MVKATIVGSIVRNILLVLGVAMLAGGMRHKEQHFNELAGARSSHNADASGNRTRDPRHLQRTEWESSIRAGKWLLSISISVVLLSVYVTFLLFSL